LDWKDYSYGLSIEIVKALIEAGFGKILKGGWVAAEKITQILRGKKHIPAIGLFNELKNKNMRDLIISIIRSTL